MTAHSSDAIGQQVWQERLTLENDLRDGMLARPAVEDDAANLVTRNLNRVAILVAISRDWAQAGAAAAETSAFAAASVLCAQRPQGAAILTLAGGKQHRFPGGSTAVPPFDWLKSVACGLIARDQASLEILCRPKSIAAAQRPEKYSDSFWPFLCAAVGSAIQNPPAAAAWFKEVEPLLAVDRIRRAEPEIVRLQIVPLLPLLRVLAGEDGDWSAALTQAIDSYRVCFEKHGQPADPQRLLPIVLCGLTGLALDRGIAHDAASLPEPFVRGEFPRANIPVAFEYAPRFAEHPEDPMVLLDLEGIPAQSRSHTLLQQGNRVIARYKMGEASIDFILPEHDQQRGNLPPALDAGERVLAADSYAEKGGVADLKDALEQLDLALKTILFSADTVPREAFVNPAGLRMLSIEPGRFRRDRLTAYRDKLREKLAALQGDKQVPPRPQTTSEIESFAKAVAAAEVVRQTIEPVLRAFPRVASGLRPQPGDYEKVFEPDAVADAQRAYDALWAAGVEVDPPSSEQADLRIFVAPAGLLRGENDLSRPFPSGYRSIARKLRPERVWVAWKYVRPGDTNGLAYDGLVWCDDHWAWFPKPYRILA